jgi:hypothetical protein
MPRKVQWRIYDMIHPIIASPVPSVASSCSVLYCFRAAHGLSGFRCAVMHGKIPVGNAKRKKKKNGRNARAPDMKKCSPLSPFSRLWSCHFTTLHMDSGSWLTLYGTTNPCIKKMQVRTVKKMTLTTSVII